MSRNSSLTITGKDVAELEARQFKLRNFKDLKTVKDFISAGKLIVRASECYQALLAQYAIQVCTIRHGGISGDAYTIKKYAQDIGMNAKTLQEWTLVYRRVIVHLNKPSQEITAKDWKTASRVAWIQDQENRTDNREKGTSRKMVCSKDPRTPEQVRKQFADNFDQKTFESEAMDWSRSFLRIKNLIEKRDLSLADKRVLTEIMEHCDHISDHINDFLSKRVRQ